MRRRKGGARGRGGLGDDAEIRGEGFGGVGDLLDALHGGGGWALGEEGAELVDKVGGPGHVDEDGAVGVVADGAAEAELEGAAAGPHAEADALDAAGDAKGALHVFFRVCHGRVGG